MNLTAPVNKNYCASIVEVKQLITLENCDNVQAISIFGFQAIVSKDVKIGDIGIFFPAETQLSEGFCENNNLYRHSELNKDTTKAGYFEDNRRVKAMKFRGHNSSALFMPLESFSYLGVSASDFSVGDEFDSINGHEICRKYVVKTRGNGMNNHQSKKVKKFIRVDSVHFPEHLDTDNYWRNCHKIPDNQDVIITQKLHGTSLRSSNTFCKRKLTLIEKIAKFFGANIKELEMGYAFGSRKVIKDDEERNQNHYYGYDLWTEEGKKLVGLLPENFIVYGELVGYTADGKPIQSGYTYQHQDKTCSLYIYRVAFINERGFTVDLTWDQMVEFCNEQGLKTVPLIWRGKHKNFKVDKYMDQQYHKTYKGCLPLDSDDTVDEGVCIRVDKMTPYILKAKSPKFFEYESKMLDTNTVDLESSQNNS